MFLAQCAHRRSHATIVLALATSLVSCGKPAPEAPKVAETSPPKVATTPTAPAPASPAHGAQPHWGYTGEAGPQAWGGLSPDFETCGTGLAQSPINIVGAGTAATTPAALDLAADEVPADVVNNGHTIQVNYSAGSTLRVGESTYHLKQYHFHSPSEHAVDGRQFPMEMHLVHASDAGKLAVVGVLIEEGAENAAFEPVWSRLPAQAGTPTPLADVAGEVEDLLPANRACHAYDGSLTTPPCSEGVSWFVMATPVQLSKEQIAAFTAIVSGNNRPVQDLHGRVLTAQDLAED